MGRDKFLNGLIFFTCATRLYETVQILSQLAVYCLLLKTLHGPAGPV